MPCRRCSPWPCPFPRPLPLALALQVWNFFWLLFCLAEFVFITLHITLSPANERTTMTGSVWARPVAAWYMGYYVFATAFFGVDMVLQSRTAFVKATGILCDDDPREILSHYLRTKFPLDALCTFPFSLCVLPIGAPAGYAFHAASWVRVLRPVRALKLLEWSNSLLPMPNHMFLQFVIFYVCIAAHTLVCGSILFYRCFEPDNLISTQESGANTYQVAIYWLMTCMSTVGFGDISPGRMETRMYSILIMLFTIYLNVYILSTGLSPALSRSVTEVRPFPMPMPRPALPSPHASLLGPTNSRDQGACTCVRGASCDLYPDTPI